MIPSQNDRQLKDYYRAGSKIVAEDNRCAPPQQVQLSSFSDSEIIRESDLADLFDDDPDPGSASLPSSLSVSTSLDASNEGTALDNTLTLDHELTTTSFLNFFAAAPNQWTDVLNPSPPLTGDMDADALVCCAPSAGAALSTLTDNCALVGSDIDFGQSHEDRSCQPNHNQSCFPIKLYQLLMDAETEGRDAIVSFTPSGSAFRIHDTAAFVSDIVPRYYRQTKLDSFKRQLFMYGFDRIPRGPDEGAYTHQHFRRGYPELARKIKRVTNAKTSSRAAWAPDFSL